MALAGTAHRLREDHDLDRAQGVVGTGRRRADEIAVLQRRQVRLHDPGELGAGVEGHGGRLAVIGLDGQRIGADRGDDAADAVDGRRRARRTAGVAHGDVCGRGVRVRRSRLATTAEDCDHTTQQHQLFRQHRIESFSFSKRTTPRRHRRSVRERPWCHGRCCSTPEAGNRAHRANRVRRCPGASLPHRRGTVMMRIAATADAVLAPDSSVRHRDF